VGAHFGEIHFDNVELPEDALIGREGEGWAQVMAELAYERAGPERFLSAFPLLVELVRTIGKKPSEHEAMALGLALAELFALRQMSLSVAGLLAAGEDPALEAALVKDLGTAFEQSIPKLAQALRPLSPSDAGDYATLFRALTLAAPSFSLRGGTREILRTVIARGLGLP
jgi:alkylation response protein AidB-like acyl-CoA dehydrogenase